MEEKLKQILKHPKAELFSDTRFLGLIAFGVIALLVTWSGIKSIQTNYELQKQISGLMQQTDVKKLENGNLKLRNEYLKTDEYLELAARQKFGKAAPGEKVYIVPKDVALANSIDIPKPEDPKQQAEEDKPTYQKNLEAWYDFFFGSKQ